jgi:hypothetical protein
MWKREKKVESVGIRVSLCVQDDALQSKSHVIWIYITSI